MKGSTTPPVKTRNAKLEASLKVGEVVYCLRFSGAELWYVSGDAALRAYEHYAGKEAVGHEPRWPGIADDVSLWVRTNGEERRIRPL